MPNVKVLNMQGAAVGEIALADDVFGVEAHVSAMHTMVRAILNAQRQGTQSARTRTEEMCIRDRAGRFSLSKSIFDKLADGGVSPPPGTAPQIFNLRRGSFALGETTESCGFCALPPSPIFARAAARHKQKLQGRYFFSGK